MDTTLVGYLLGNLDPDTRKQVEARLRRDPSARAELARVRRSLGPLATLRSSSAPPPGLVRRTLARLAAHRQLPAAPPLSSGQRVGVHWLIPRADLAVAALVLVIVLACLGPWLAACQRQARVRSGQQHLARIWSALRLQADTRSRPTEDAGWDSAPALLGTCPDQEHPRCSSDLDTACSTVPDDRWPLLLERPDSEEAIAPTWSGQNVLCVGGQVRWCNQASAERLASCPVVTPGSEVLAFPIP
jgi:hypothetical protein